MADKSIKNIKTVLITGGSSGLGLEISKLFAKDGYRLLWVSKSQDEIDVALPYFKSMYPDIEIQSLVIDLSNMESARKVYEWSNAIGPLQVLVNNAGFGTYGYLHEIPFEKELQMINLNVINLYQLTRLFLNDMMQRNEGKIMNISSNTSFQPVPMMSTYAATKAFVKHFSQSVSDELKYKKSKVTLTVVCPPAIKNTKFQAEANMNHIRTFDSILTATPEEVARDAYDGTMKGKSFVVAGWKLRNIMWLYKLLPDFILKEILKRELQKTN